MSDMEATDIIDELRGFAAGSESARASLMRDAADALEAAEKRAEENRKEIDRLSRELQVAEDQANTIAGDLAQAERERDNWKMSAEEAERAEKRWKARAVEAERERDRLDEAFDRDLPGRYAEVETQRNALAAEVEELRAERDEFKRLFTECHPVHLEGVQRAYKAEATLVKAREYIEALSNSPEHPLEAHHRGVLLAILDESPTERETPADEWEYGLADDGATEPYSDISTDRDWILDGVHPLDEGTKLLRRRPAGPWMEVVPDDRA